jgi:hypothetical protein
MTATIVTTGEELKQIVQLSQKNVRTNISEEEKIEQGFITWNYSFELLEQMNAQHPHIIIKDGNVVIGYALVALRDASLFHPDLKAMVDQLEVIMYNNKRLSEYQYYVIGQICIDKAYRGKCVFEMLYQQHKKIFEKDFDFVITEISTNQ